MSNKTLLYVFLALLALLLISRFWPSSSDRSFREELVAIDTARVTAVSIHPKSEELETVRFERTEEGWMVEQGDVRAEADQDAVRRMLGLLLDIRPQRLAATREERWVDFNVTDSLATRVTVEEDGRTTLDLMLGRFSFPQNMQNMQDATSYVRLRDEEEVYAVPGFLAVNFDRDFNSWRNRTVLRANPDSLTRLAFTYPADSSFTLDRSAFGWTIDGLPADSAAVAQYLAGLRSVSSAEFVDGATDLPAAPAFALTVERTDGAPVTIEAFPRTGEDGYLLRSGENPGATFAGNDSTGVFRTLFPARSRFVP